MASIKKTFILLIIGFLLFSLLASINPIKICKATGNTLYVDDSGGADYTTIQAAIDAANTSDTIIVASGNYNENLHINKSLNLSGTSKENTIITGNTTGHVIEITTDNIEISEFTIQNAVGVEYNCIMMNNADNCTITNNIIKGSDKGIYLMDSHSNTIKNNNIRDNDANGIYTSFSDNNIFENNQILYNENGLNIGSYSDNNQIFENNIIGKTGIPKGTGLNMGTSTTGNIVYLNHFYDFDKNANDLGSGNTWYQSSTQNGNYWDDYAGEDANDDGKGDTPYNIPGTAGVQDIYPLGIFTQQNQKPIAYIISITPSPAYTGQNIHFTGSYNEDSQIIDYEWKANSQIIGKQKDIYYSHLTTGTYTISFRVMDNNEQWSDPDYSTLTIYPQGSQQNQKPTATILSITPSIATYGEQIYFNGIGTDTDGEILEYYWSSNLNNKLANTPAFYNTNLAVGTHTITFKVRDNENAWSDPQTWTIKINANTSIENNPPVSIPGGPYIGVTNTTITFNGSLSHDPDPDDSLTYNWDFGDETTENSQTPIITHIYTTAGNFTVKLTVTDTHGIQSVQTTIATITDTNNNQTNNQNDNWKIPGFEIIIVIITLTVIVLVKKRKEFF